MQTIAILLGVCVFLGALESLFRFLDSRRSKRLDAES
jgi:hypothetical protein